MSWRTLSLTSFSYLMPPSWRTKDAWALAACTVDGARQPIAAPRPQWLKAQHEVPNQNPRAALSGYSLSYARSLAGTHARTHACSLSLLVQRLSSCKLIYNLLLLHYQIIYLHHQYLQFKSFQAAQVLHQIQLYYFMVEVQVLYNNNCNSNSSTNSRYSYNRDINNFRSRIYKYTINRMDRWWCNEYSCKYNNWIIIKL